MPPTNETEINNVWASTVKDDDAVELVTCPSGQTCYARRPGLEGLMLSGELMNLDSLTSLVDQKHLRRVRGGNGVADDEVKIDADKLMTDPKALQSIISLADRLVPQIVVTPRVLCHYTMEDDKRVVVSDDDRLDNVVYTDQIDFQDKLFLMNYGLAGTRDAERFRAESAGVVAGVVSVESVPMPAKRAGSGNRSKARKRGK